MPSQNAEAVSSAGKVLKPKKQVTGTSQVMGKGEESQLSAPEGFSLIPVNLMFSSSSSDSFAYLCTKSTDPRPGIDVITEIVRRLLLF